MLWNKPTCFINIGNSISKGHFVTAAIIMTYKYRHLGLGSQCSGEQTLDWGWRNLGSNLSSPDYLLSNKYYFSLFKTSCELFNSHRLWDSPGIASSFAVEVDLRVMWRLDPGPTASECWCTDERLALSDIKALRWVTPDGKRMWKCCQPQNAVKAPGGASQNMQTNTHLYHTHILYVHLHDFYIFYFYIHRNTEYMTYFIFVSR